MNFIIFDTEYTSWKGCLENGREPWQKEEVVQIAALKVDAATLNVVDTFNVYVKPVINPVLSDYFIDLTKITNEILSKKGVAFATAYKDFYDFAKNSTCFSHGWSANVDKIADGKTIGNNLDYNNMTEPQPLDYQNIAPWFKMMYAKRNINITKQASGDIARLLGREENIKHLGLDIHNALYDVYSILEGIKYFKADRLL